MSFLKKIKDLVTIPDLNSLQQQVNPNQSNTSNQANQIRPQNSQTNQQNQAGGVKPGVVGQNQPQSQQPGQNQNPSQTQSVNLQSTAASDAMLKLNKDINKEMENIKSGLTVRIDELNVKLTALQEMINKVKSPTDNVDKKIDEIEKNFENYKILLKDISNNSMNPFLENGGENKNQTCSSSNSGNSGSTSDLGQKNIQQQSSSVQPQPILQQQYPQPVIQASSMQSPIPPIQNIPSQAPIYVQNFLPKSDSRDDDDDEHIKSLLNEIRQDTKHIKDASRNMNEKLEPAILSNSNADVLKVSRVNKSLYEDSIRFANQALKEHGFEGKQKIDDIRLEVDGNTDHDYPEKLRYDTLGPKVSDITVEDAISGEGNNIKIPFHDHDVEQKFKDHAKMIFSNSLDINDYKTGLKHITSQVVVEKDPSEDILENLKKELPHIEDEILKQMLVKIQALQGISRNQPKSSLQFPSQSLQSSSQTEKEAVQSRPQQSIQHPVQNPDYSQQNVPQIPELQRIQESLQKSNEETFMKLKLSQAQVQSFPADEDKLDQAILKLQGKQTTQPQQNVQQQVVQQQPILQSVQSQAQNQPQFQQLGQSQIQTPVESSSSQLHLQIQSQPTHVTQLQPLTMPQVQSEVQKSDQHKSVSYSPKFTQNAPTEKCFILSDGRVLKSINDLLELLENISEHLFTEHVNFTKNDFANWVLYVFEEKELAKLMFETKNKGIIIQAIRDFYKIN